MSTTMNTEAAKPFAPVSTLRGIQRVRWEIISRFKSTPWLYIPLVGSRSRDLHGNFRGINRKTELLIDAYPRSANTYATYGFLHCQKDPVNVSHHLHAPAAILYAAQHKIPTLTIIRDPFDACASILAYLPDYGIEQAFRDYLNYYRAVRKSMPHAFVAKFETVTADLGKVIEALNAKYSRKYTVFSNTPEEIDAVRAKTKKIITTKFGGAAFDKGRNSVPSSVSTGPKQSLAAMLSEQHAEKAFVREAKALFAEIHNQATV